MSSIIVAGLGPGAWEQVTLEVKTLLDSADTIYLRTTTHPTADHLPANLKIHSFDYLYEREMHFEDIYAQIATELLKLASAADPSQEGGHGGPPLQNHIIYCVPGHPAIGEASVRYLRRTCAEKGVEVRLVAGLSFIEPVCTALGVDPLEHGFQIVDGTELAGYGNQPTENNPKSKIQNPKSNEPVL